MPKFAANLSLLFTDRPLPERFAAAAAAGFSAVELLFPYHDLDAATFSRLLAENHLQLALFNICPGDYAAGERGLACLPDRVADFARALQMVEPYVAALRPPRVHLMAGILPRGTDRELATHVYCHNVGLAARTLAPYGVTVCLEAINRFSMPDFFVHRQEETARIVETVGEDNVAMQFDCFHCQMEQGNVSGMLRNYLPYIGHIQIAGAPERQEPDRGELRYEYLFDLVDSLGYTGFVGCEYNPAGQTEAGLGWFAPWRVSH